MCVGKSPGHSSDIFSERHKQERTHQSSIDHYHDNQSTIRAPIGKSYQGAISAKRASLKKSTITSPSESNHQSTIRALSEGVLGITRVFLDILSVYKSYIRASIRPLPDDTRDHQSANTMVRYQAPPERQKSTSQHQYTLIRKHQQSTGYYEALGNRLWHSDIL
jgi:hypothetical protein